jgi:hypothetical protein
MSPRNSLTASTSAPLPSTSRNGKAGSLVSSTLPTRGTVNPARSRIA